MGLSFCLLSEISHHFLVFAVLLLMYIARADEVIRTHSGHLVPLDAIRPHLPNLPDHLLSTAVYEHIPNHDLLISENHTISIRKLAPQLTRVTLDKPVRIYLDEERFPNLEVGPYLREGAGYTFVFDDDNQNTLIAAWGPTLSLRQIQCSARASIFVNSAVSEPNREPYLELLEHPSPHLKQLKAKLSNTQVVSNLTPITDRVVSSKKEFQLFFIADLSMTNNYCGNYNASNKVIATLVYQMKPIFKDIGIVPRAEAIKGTVVGKGYNRYRLPENVKNCVSENTTVCHKSALLLKAFRNVPAFKSRRRDATVVVTGYGLDNGAIGAAYIAAACNRDWYWAWMQDTNSNKDVLAHELGHLLGALHDESGIMESAVNSESELKFSQNSNDAMALFVEEVSSPWCLRKIDRADDVGKLLFRVPVPHMDGNVHAHDVAFVGKAESSSRELALLFTNGTYTSSSLSFSTLSHVIRENTDKYSVGSWSTPIHVPDATTSVSGGGGLAFGKIRSKDSKDFIVAYIDTQSTIKYKVCFEISTGNSPSCREWSPAYDIPSKKHGRTQTVGITIKDVRNTGRKDLIVVFAVNKKELYYEVGWNLDSAGNCKSGWSKLRRIKGDRVSLPVWGFSVAAFDIEQKGQTDLVFYSSEILGGESLEFIDVGRQLTNWAALRGSWIDSIPAPKPLFQKTFRGGIDISLFPGDKYATTVLVHNGNNELTKQREIYLDFSFNVTGAVQADADGSLFENIVDGRSHGCLECYRDDLKKPCLDLLKSCDDSGKHSNTSIRASKYLTISSFERQDQDRVNQSNIFCVGFDALFVSAEGDTCEKDSSRSNVVGKGVAVLLGRELKNETHPEETIEVSYVLEGGSGEIWSNKSREVANKGRAPAERIRIEFTPKVQTKKERIVEALKKFRRKTGWDAVFKDVAFKESEVKEINGNKFVVILQFKWKFKQKQIRDEDWTPYGSGAILV